jgi:hypothetical protein
MKVAAKYLILFIGFVAAVFSLCSSCSMMGGSTGAGITAAGAFIAFAMLEIQDLKIENEMKE